MTVSVREGEGERKSVEGLEGQICCRMRVAARRVRRGAMKGGFCAYFVVLACTWTACSRSVTTPTPATLGPVQLTRLSVTGNASLTAIGETSQLTAVATFSDGAVKDVSRDTRWGSTDPSVMMVS